MFFNMAHVNYNPFATMETFRDANHFISSTVDLNTSHVPHDFMSIDRRPSVHESHCIVNRSIDFLNFLTKEDEIMKEAHTEPHSEYTITVSQGALPLDNNLNNFSFLRILKQRKQTTSGTDCLRRMRVHLQTLKRSLMHRASSWKASNTRRVCSQVAKLARVLYGSLSLTLISTNCSNLPAQSSHTVRTGTWTDCIIIMHKQLIFELFYKS